MVMILRTGIKLLGIVLAIYLNWTLGSLLLHHSILQSLVSLANKSIFVFDMYTYLNLFWLSNALVKNKNKLKKIFELLRNLICY